MSKGLNLTKITIDTLTIAVGREYAWLNGATVKVTGIWSDRNGAMIDTVTTAFPAEPEMVGRKGETTPNGFYWQMHAA